MDTGQEKSGPKKSTLGLLLCCARSGSTSPPLSHPPRQPHGLLSPSNTFLRDDRGPQGDGFTAVLPSRPPPMVERRFGPQARRAEVQYTHCSASGIHHPAVLTPGLKQAPSAQYGRIYSNIAQQTVEVHTNIPAHNFGANDCEMGGRTGGPNVGNISSPPTRAGRMSRDNTTRDNRVHNSAVIPRGPLSLPDDSYRGLQTVHRGRGSVNSSDNGPGGGTRARTNPQNTGDVSPMSDGGDDVLGAYTVSPVTPDNPHTPWAEGSRYPS
ncbi:hypothetical protein B0J18DRAFT_435169 [Chaetomium sp. MPI-SDFR-AT-0129]|nr:hypothetical protein B0J18DRAFT_435169 [Chaetomium sp. MPI-SDFR-AT-0129]